ncbi:FtsQ-type POTRA domain-containing protein [Leucobacter salsicius]|uniref:FtsQ-type POTRA domain-containing protein n=1 Tax=Leucobacter salsicius TaxID=664638 RepID=UPI00034ABEE3|nr:FtsQ-type POTRA domain-containing protein [Leucobacter salsicius]
MKRPGGFDREADHAPEPEAASRVDPAHRADQASQADSAPRGNSVPRIDPAARIARALRVDPTADAAAGAVAGSLPEGFGAPAHDPDVQLTDVIDDAALAGAANAKSAGNALAVPRAAMTRALAWAGVGAPKDPVRAADRRVRRAANSRRRRERGERLRFAAQLRRQRRGWLIAGGAVLALAMFVAVTAFTPLTAVRDVRIEGAQAVPEDELVRALQRFEGVPLALVEDTQVHRALEVFPLIQRYQVERIPPHTLVVQIAERVPVIAIERNGTFEQFDAAGVRVGAGDAAPAGVPVGTGSVADLASPAFASAARTVRDMPQELRARVAGVTATSAQDVTLTLDNGLQVLWGGDVDIARKSVVLQSMLSALGERPLERIDVSSPDAPVFQ